MSGVLFMIVYMNKIFTCGVWLITAQVTPGSGLCCSPLQQCLMPAGRMGLRLLNISVAMFHSCSTGWRQRIVRTKLVRIDIRGGPFYWRGGEGWNLWRGYHAGVEVYGWMQGVRLNGGLSGAPNHLRKVGRVPSRHSLRLRHPLLRQPRLLHAWAHSIVGLWSAMEWRRHIVSWTGVLWAM